MLIGRYDTASTELEKGDPPMGTFQISRRTLLGSALVLPVVGLARAADVTGPLTPL